MLKWLFTVNWQLPKTLKWLSTVKLKIIIYLVRDNMFLKLGVDTKVSIDLSPAYLYFDTNTSYVNLLRNALIDNAI